LLKDKKLLKGIKGIKKSDAIFSIDAQHVVFNHLDLDASHLKSSKNIFVLGSPTQFNLKAFHHTMDLYDYQKASLSSFFLKN